MSGIYLVHLRDRVIVPTLCMLGHAEPAAIELMLGTALQESDGGRYLIQIPDGPACGVWGMEAATHNDIWNNFLAYQPELATKVKTFGNPAASILSGNLYYACAMARIQYLRAPEKLPAPGDIVAQAAYYKRHFNTEAGKATVEEYLAKWRAEFPHCPIASKDQA